MFTCRQVVWYCWLLLAALVLPAQAAHATSDAGIDFAQSVLQAESVCPADVERHLSRLRTISMELEATGTIVGDERQKAAAIHRFVHAEVLSGEYSADAHTLSGLLDSGRFNCLSATLLFFVLAAPYELPLLAIESPGHVAVGLPMGDHIALIETTLPLWRPRILRGESLASDSLRCISGQQLLAAVYYNRGWRHLQAGEYAAAASSNRQALRLDPNCEPARKNLLATFNNWALALCTAEQYTQALEVLRAGQSIDRQFAPFEANRQHILHRAQQAGVQTVD